MASSFITGFVVLNKDLLISLAAVGLERFSEFFQTQNLKGICLLPDSINFICKNLVNSKQAYLLDIKTQVFQELDDEEKTNLEKSENELTDKKLIFPKAKVIMDEISEILQCKNIIVLSEDKDLLKYLKCRDLIYFLPTDLLVQELKVNNPDFDNEGFQKFKQMIISQKKDKMVLYHSHQELESLIMSRYSGLVVKV